MQSLASQLSKVIPYPITLLEYSFLEIHPRGLHHAASTNYSKCTNYHYNSSGSACIIWRAFKGEVQLATASDVVAPAKVPYSEAIKRLTNHIAA